MDYTISRKYLISLDNYSYGKYRDSTAKKYDIYYGISSSYGIYIMDYGNITIMSYWMMLLEI
jgi:hypothetical protein